MNRKPHLGAQVVYWQGDFEAPGQYGDRTDESVGIQARRDWPGTNGTREHVAFVTRVLRDGTVNLTVLLDMHPPSNRPGVHRLTDEELEQREKSGWRWPDHG